MQNFSFGDGVFTDLGVSPAQAQPAKVGKPDGDDRSPDSHACPDSFPSAGCERISDRSSCETFL